MTAWEDTVEGLIYPCQQTREDVRPSALEFAFKVMGLTDLGHQLAIIEEGNVELEGDGNGETFFSQGWYSGVMIAGTATMPMGSDFGTGGSSKKARAWTTGYVAGQVARRFSYRYPWCIFRDHEH